jgi:hypothetical protein
MEYNDLKTAEFLFLFVLISFASSAKKSPAHLRLSFFYFLPVATRQRTPLFVDRIGKKRERRTRVLFSTFCNNTTHLRVEKEASH